MAYFCEVKCLTYQSSHSVLHTETPLKARDETTQARKHSTDIVYKGGEAMEEYSRKRAVMTLHSPDLLTPLPPLPAQQRI